jgi:drug/metabolite transporter (DMT)-like permease
MSIVDRTAGTLSFKHYLAFAALCAIWGSTWLAIRIVVRDIPPCLAASLRFLIAAGLLAVIAVWQEIPLPKTRSEWRATLILSITMMALPYGLIFWAEQHITSSITAVLYSSSPLVAALLTPAMTGRPVPRSAIYSLLVGVGGMAMLLNVELSGSANTLIGGIAVLVGVVSSAWSTVYAKRETHDVHPIVSTGIQLFVGALGLGIVSMALERNRSVEWTTRSIIALLFLAIFGSAIAFALYYWLLRSMDAYKATTINLIVPFVAIAEGAAFQEVITGMMLLSSVIVLGSVGFALKAQADSPIGLRLSRPAESDE